MLLSLKIENTYALYPSVTTCVTDIEVPEPPAEDDPAWEEWVLAQIFDRTGTGKTSPAAPSPRHAVPSTAPESAAPYSRIKAPERVCQHPQNDSYEC